MTQKEFEFKIGYYYPDIDGNIASSFRSSMQANPRRAEGKPVDRGNLLIFQQIDQYHQQGSTIIAAIRLVFEEQRVGLNDDVDHEDEIDTVVREYRRYRKTRDAGLDPSRTYDDNSLAEFILSKQFALAAAIFATADKKRRIRICGKLNERIMHRVIE